MFDDLSLYPRLNRIIGQIGVPWYNIGGNHDLNFEAPDAQIFARDLQADFGPPYYAFEYGGALFLMLDNVDYLGADPARPYSAGLYEGRIGERQLAFIANVLKETPADKLIVTAMHIPLRNYLDPNDPATNTADRADFLKLLAGRPNTLSVSGHTHTTEHHYFGAEDGFAGPAPHHHHVLTAVSGSWWSGPYDHRGIAVADSRDGSPNGFHILSIDGARYATRFQPANEPNDRQMRIVLDSVFHGDRKELYNAYRMGELLGSPLPQARVRRPTSSSMCSTAVRARRSSIASAAARRCRCSAWCGPIRSSRRSSPATKRPRSRGSRPSRARTSGRRDCRPILKPARIASRCGRSTNMAASIATI